jgi:hypothetical protein
VIDINPIPLFLTGLADGSRQICKVASIAFDQAPGFPLMTARRRILAAENRPHGICVDPGTLFNYCFACFHY